MDSQALRPQAVPLPWVRTDQTPSPPPAAAPDPPAPALPTPPLAGWRHEPPWLLVAGVVAATCAMAAMLAVSALRGLANIAPLLPVEAYGVAGLLGAVAGFLMAWVFNPNRNLWTAFCVASLMAAGTVAVGSRRASLRDSTGWEAVLQFASGNPLELLALVGICLLLLVGAIMRDRLNRG